MSSQENTAIIRLMGDFRNSFSKSKIGKPVSQVLNFEQSLLSSDDSMELGSRKIMDLVQDGQKQADRTWILHLENKVSTLEMRNKQSQIEQDKERELLRQESERQRERLNDIQNQLQFLTEKEKLAKEETEEIKKKAETTRTTYEQKVMNLQREKMKLEMEMNEASISNQNTITSQQNEILKLKKDNSTFENDLEETKTQLKLTRRRFHDAQCKIKELEQAETRALQLELTVKDLEQKISDNEESLIIARTMKSQIARIQEFEKENKMLKERNNFYRATNENSLLLKEKMEDLKSKLERAELRLSEMDKLMVENENLKTLVSKWEVFDSSGVKKYQTAEDFKQQIMELQQKEALLTNDKESLESKVRCCELALKLCDGKLENMTKDLVQEKVNITHNADLIRRLQRKLLLVSKERDSYRKVLDSYENQVTMDFTNSTRLRINELECTLENYRSQMEVLETDIKSTKDENSKFKIEAGQSQAYQKSSMIPSETDAVKIQELSDRVRELESKYAIVLEEKFILESRIEQRALQKLKPGYHLQS